MLSQISKSSKRVQIKGIKWIQTTFQEMVKQLNQKDATKLKTTTYNNFQPNPKGAVRFWK